MNKNICSKPRIVLIGPTLNIVSGVSTHLKQLFDSELAEIYDLRHFEVGSEGKTETLRQKLLRFFKSPIQLAAAIIREKPAIVHINTSLDAKAFWRDVIYLLIARALRRKILYQVHGGALDKFCGDSKLFAAFLKMIFRIPDSMVVLASSEMTVYKGFTRFKDLRMIPNAIDLADFASDHSISSNSSEYRLVYVGRLALDKGIYDAVEAIKMVLGSDTSIRLQFLIAGTGPIEQELRGKVQELDLGDIVRFVGPIFGMKKIEFWKDADLFVFPTFHKEGLPYSILESLASGTPIVATRMGGIVDAMTDGEEGVFVEAHDPSGVADVIRFLLGNRGLLKQMSDKCVNRAQKFYGLDRMVSQFRQLYRELDI